MLDFIHPNPLIATLAVVLGCLFGLALAMLDWKSHPARGGILTTILGPITALTGDKVVALNTFIESSPLLTPILWGLNVGVVTFMLALGTGTAGVFTVNFVVHKRKGDPEAFSRSARRAIGVLGNGLYQYITAPPDVAAANTISDLKRHAETLSVIHNTLVNELTTVTNHNPQHFKDAVDALARLLLQHSFGETADLQQFRLAFFERRGDRLEYMVATNNRDWTAHSMQGFDASSSFMGTAIEKNRPMVYPKDKKHKASFGKRKNARYKSFLVVPVPCGQPNMKNVGALTIDYLGTQDVFAERRIDEAFAFSQFVHSLYILNVKEAEHAHPSI